VTALGQASGLPTAVRRRPPRAVGVLAAAVLLTAGSYLGPALLGDSAGPAADAPRDILTIPGGAPAAGGTSTAEGRFPLPERIAFWTTRVQEQPSDFLSYIQLAVTWSEQGRLRVDLEAYARADEAIERALAIAPAYPPAFAVRASIRFATHDFAGAEADARTTLAAIPTDAAALAILGDAVLELGRLNEAAATYDRLAEVAGGPALDIRTARLAYLGGDPAAALELARKALIGASGGGPTGEETSDAVALGFYHFALGEYARLAGDADLAGAQFRAALELRGDDLGALLGLARVAAFRGDLDGATAALERATAIAPLPESEALLGDVLAARGRPGDAAASADAYAVVRLTGTLSELAGSVYDRALITFESDHGGADAVLLARAEAALATRADAAGHDLVAWALHGLGREEAAWAASLEARAGGIHDARILFHAGAIAVARGDAATGEALLRDALALGPALDPLERAEALSLLGG